MFYVFLEDTGHQLHRKVNFYSKYKRMCILVEKAANSYFIGKLNVPSRTEKKPSRFWMELSMENRVEGKLIEKLCEELSSLPPQPIFTTVVSHRRWYMYRGTQLDFCCTGAPQWPYNFTARGFRGKPSRNYFTGFCHRLQRRIERQGLNLASLFAPPPHPDWFVHKWMAKGNEAKDETTTTMTTTTTTTTAAAAKRLAYGCLTKIDWDSAIKPSRQNASPSCLARLLKPLSLKQLRFLALQHKGTGLSSSLRNLSKRCYGAAHWAFLDNFRVITIKPTTIKKKQNNFLVF